MGRPVNKHFFGATQIHGFAKIGAGAAADAFIVKQTSTREFIVNVGGTLATVNLVAKPVADLAVGEMVIFATKGSSTLMVKNFKGHVATLSDGTQGIWSTRTANDAPVDVSKQGAIVADPAAVVTPVITIGTQPASQSKTVGQTATFTVAATVAPTATLTYQWKKNGTNISGATSASYTTPALVLGDDAAAFTVVVSSAGAAAKTSDAATLTVTAAV